MQICLLYFKWIYLCFTIVVLTHGRDILKFLHSWRCEQEYLIFEISASGVSAEMTVPKRESKIFYIKLFFRFYKLGWRKVFRILFWWRVCATTSCDFNVITNNGTLLCLLLFALSRVVVEILKHQWDKLLKIVLLLQRFQPWILCFLKNIRWESRRKW